MRAASLRSVVIAFLLFSPCVARAQIQIGTVRGTVIDPVGAVLPGATVVLSNPVAGSHEVTTTDGQGRFVFNNVPFARYGLSVEAPGFQAVTAGVSVRSNVPLTVSVRLAAAGAAESVTVRPEAGLVEEDSAGTDVVIDGSLIARTPEAVRPRTLSRVIATAPGVTTQNNGLLHVRGVEDGILYVVDGVPTADRIDLVSATPFDADAIRSLELITGNVPAEFGGRSGAVAVIHPESGIDAPLNGSLNVGAGSFRTGDLAATLAGSARDKAGFFVAARAGRSYRYLDPVDPRNFNNRGGMAALSFRADWHPTGRDILLLNLAGGGTDFRVPNDFEQEAAGQRQRQQLRDNSRQLSWQRVWSPDAVTNLAYFRRSYSSRLFGSEFDTPLTAEQDRGHVRQGVVASLTMHYRGHTLKAGLEAARVGVHEFFTFAVTDQEEAEEREVSDEALEFGPERPFVFRDRGARRQFSAYVQDSFSPLHHLTVNVGLRYDRTTLPLPERRLSPRVGAVYYVGRTRTAVRASFNRLFMPPQVENLLLSNSEQARALSPFAAGERGGGASVRAERVSAYEVGFSQDVLGLFRLDAAHWWRSFRNFDDPNTFFNTTVVFPNSVAEGLARGLDVRVDVPERGGWSGYLSYTNSRVLQTGPINGGLFLTDEFVEIGPGTRFIPDHDQRNVGSFAVTYSHRKTGLWAALSGRHESGVPLEVDEERLEELRSAPGAELVDFERGRVRAWTVFNLAAGAELLKGERVSVSAQVSVQNVAGRPFAYNFGSPFEGTHFGHPRLWSGRVKFVFR